MTAIADFRAWVRGVPLRVKLVTSVLTLVAAALVVISVMTTVFLRSYLIGQVDRDLYAAAHSIEKILNSGRNAQVALPSDFVAVEARAYEIGAPTYDVNNLGRQQLPPFPTSIQGFADLVGEPFTVSAEDHRSRWRMLYTELPDGRYAAIGQSLNDVDLAVARLAWIDLLVGSAVLILLASIGAGIVRTSLKPLVDIERTAAAIAGGDLSRRVPDPEAGVAEPSSELGRLSRALNAMLSQIEAAFTARAASEAAARSAEAAARNAALAAQSSEARARRSEERMRQFIADASHELRTPLTTIRGFAELYRQGAVAEPEKTAQLLRRIEDEASRMGLLVEDLLLLARLDRERPLKTAPVELPVLATESVEAARAVAPQRQIALEVEPGSGDLVVLGDDSRLRQVLGNLMTNAVTHTPPEASVTLRLRREADEAVVDVVDTGQGLTPEQAERVFERFYRVDSARTRSAAGATSTGLGLAIVAAIVAAHRGTVQVDGTPGGGTTFRVRLPLAPETDQGEQP